MSCYLSSPRSKVYFCEFFPEPDEIDGGPDGEWIEIYNRTSDSLFLDHCRISKSRTSSSLSTRFDIPEGTVIGPSKLLVFGREKAIYKDVIFDFKMVSTKQSLLLLCDENNQDLLLDSLTYTTEYVPLDSIYSIDGYVSTKRHDQFSGDTSYRNWCLTEINPAAGSPSASPGGLLTDCEVLE